MKILHVKIVNHCGNVLAHRGCIFAGPVRGTTIYCDTPNAELYDACPYSDHLRLSYRIPNRRMLPERDDRCVMQLAWWHIENKYDQHSAPLSVAAGRKHLVRGKSVEDSHGFGRAESSSAVVKENREEKATTR